MHIEVNNIGAGSIKTSTYRFFSHLYDLKIYRTDAFE